jgi:S-adenosylmethionine decarboxylase proenzyme
MSNALMRMGRELSPSEPDHSASKNFVQPGQTSLCGTSAARAISSNTSWDNQSEHRPENRTGMSTTPIHLLVDFAVDDAELLRAPQPGISYLREAALAGGVTILFEHVHQFEPGGYSGVLLLAQSHATIHTWIEDNIISIDVFACGPIDVEAILTVLRQRFRPKAEHIERRTRGISLHTPRRHSPSLT